MNSEILVGIGLELTEDNSVIRKHSKEELDSVKAKSSAMAILNKTSASDKPPLSELSYETMVAAQQAEATPVRPMSADFCVIGDKPINITLHRMINDKYSEVSEPDSKDAAHLSVNVQRSSDSGEYAIVDKDLIRDEPALFQHRSSYVEGQAIYQVRPEGQMEATAIIVKEGFEELDTLIEKVTEFSNILSVKAAENIIATGEELKKKVMNMIYILNKGSIRNAIDQRILAYLSPDEAKTSTKAERYDQVTRVMDIVNQKLQTFAMSPYVATLELSDWTYSIMQVKGSKFSEAKGRKYFALPNGLALKVDMRGSKAGGKYPISKDYIDTFKTEAAKIQILFLTVMENQVRADLGLEPLDLPFVQFKDAAILEGKDEEKIISYILKNNNSSDSADSYLNEAHNKIYQAIEEAFKEINQGRVINNL